MTGEQLEVRLYRNDVHSSTMRAELARLRALLGPDVLDSRPYRMVTVATGDWQTVVSHLVAGRLREACAAYRGPLLPCAEAPGVIEIRESLHRHLRSAVLTCDIPDLMATWTRTRWGADDLEMWRRQAQMLPRTSPLRSVAVLEVERLDREFGRQPAPRRLPG